MSKFSIIFLSHLLFTTAAWSIEQNNSTQSMTSIPNIYNLNQAERTNLNTENYVWKIELIFDTENKSISHKLLNPNPKFPMLDQRALEIAQNYRYEELEKLNNLLLAQQPENTPQGTAQHIKNYILNIKFPLGLVWKKKPRFQNLAKISEKLCELRTDDPAYEHAVIRKDRSYTFETRLLVKSNGMVNSVNLLNASPDISLNNMVHKELMASRFHPYNENGIPTNFEAEQPVQLVCP